MSRKASDELRRRARSAGVAIEYTDAGGRRRRSSVETLEAICDLVHDEGAVRPRVGADGAMADPLQPVVLVRAGRLRSGLGTHPGSPLHAEVVLEDGTPAHSLVASDSASLLSQLEAAELPLGIHRIEWSVDGNDGRSTLLVAPERFPHGAHSSSSASSANSAHDEPAEARPRLAAFVAPYGPWTREHPLCSVDRLAEVGSALTGAGVSVIATLPVGAPGLGERFDPSPYSPVSRFHLNELYIGDQHLPAPEPHELPADPGAAVDWPRLLRTRTRQLHEAARTLTLRDRGDLDGHLREHPDVADYAEFCADGDAELRRIHEVGQWLADRSLTELREDLANQGQVLALDVPVGSRPDGWEVQAHPQLFVAGASIGAPPDAFFTGGQNWGLPPLDPVASRLGGHRVWADLLERTCRRAGIVRIDHVMQIHRLWWVPDGHDATDGAYVQYPADELLAVAAIVATRTDTLMVGEDLGTVPPEVRRLLVDWGLPGMYEEQFALHDGETVLPEVPAGSWAGIRTHDMAPLAAVATEVDTSPYRRALSEQLGHRVGASTPELAAAMVERLRRSDAAHVVLDIDDALADERSHNVPGTVGPQNWSHRLRLPTDELAEDPDVRRVLAATETRTVT